MNAASAPPQEAQVRRVSFLSDGARLVGNLYLPENYQPNKKYPAVVVSGSWTTVKEQMAGLYAEQLAGEDFITLAFDFRNFGESEGTPRFYENPPQKVADIGNAVSYLQSLPQVDAERIGALGICAGSMYTLMAAAADKRIKSVVTAASWLHDAEAVKLFYGGEEGVQSKIAAAQAAKQRFAETGEVEYIPSISTTDASAAMYGPYDYYLNPERGAIPEWSDDKFAVMTWEDWLTLDPMPSADALTAPTLMIHSDGAVLPQYTKQYFARIAADNYRRNDIARFEGYYASVVYSFFAGMGLTVIAEDVANLGRIDLTIQLADHTYIIEFKMVKRKSKTNSALQQIIQQGYAAKYSGKIYQIGIEFSETKRNIVAFAWQQA